jgi:adenylate kinase family enzyme
MGRIIVVGCQGSGKTSLALKLGRKLGLPVMHLDVLYWRPGWKASDKASFRVRVADAIAGEGWVVDGSFSGLAFDLAMACADSLIVIERPALALPVAHRLAFGLRSRRDTARLARRMPGNWRRRNFMP